MKRILVTVAASACAAGLAVAAPVTADEAKTAVGNWLRSGVSLDARLGHEVASVRTCTPSAGATFHVVRLAQGGFVVTGADTQVEPVIAFSDAGDLVEDDGNPLWVLLKGDLEARQRKATGGIRQQSASLAVRGTAVAVTGAEALWEKLLAPRLLSAASGKSSISDVRVGPLLETAWAQEDFQNYGLTDADHICYNYYTPNHFPCGCVATAGAQIMRYFRHPQGAVSAGTYACNVEVGKNWIDDYSYYPIYETRWYAMKGGTYAWSSMPGVPANGCTAAQREAIGKLTYDVGVSCGMSYGEGGSSAAVYMLVKRLVDRFGYSSAVGVTFKGGGFYNGSSFAYTLERLKSATIPSLDAGLPVALGLSGAGGHAVVGDGYGYANGNFYLHINLGWANLGGGDAWYMPPNIDDYTSIDTIVYNIYPTQTAGASIVSGRVLDASGKPVAGVRVTATSGGLTRATDDTDARGVYALIAPAGEYTISAAKNGQTASTVVNPAQCVSTHYTDDGSYSSTTLPSIGNVHGIELKLAVESDPPDEPEPSGPVFGPGVWTTDVDAVKSAAAKDGRMICVVSANYGGCYYSQIFWPVAKDAKFLAWAKSNGVYLVSSDGSCEPGLADGVTAASQWFSTLYRAWPETDGYIYYPTVATVFPSKPNEPVGYDVFRPGRTVGGGAYDGTVDSLISCLGYYLSQAPDEPPPDEPPPDEPEPSGPVFGPGVWTTDVDAVKSAAARDGRMICVVSANYGGCYYSQIFWPVAKDAKFLAWAKSNGVYLVSSDGSCEPGLADGVTAASQWFSTLYWAWPETDGCIYYPTVATVLPAKPNEPVGYDVFRPGQTVGGGTYDGTVDSLIACLGHYLSQAPDEPKPDDPEPLNGSLLGTDAKPQIDVKRGEVAPYEVAAAVYNGYLYDGELVVGTVQVNVSKGKADRKSGRFEAKVTAAAVFAGSTKKVRFKGGIADETGKVTGLVASGHTLDVMLGVDGLGGTCDGYKIDGARNVFSGKSAEDKSAAADAARLYQGTYNVASEVGALSVSVDKKGKAKVSGTIEGNKVSATSQLLVGMKCSVVPVVIAKKTNLAFCLLLGENGKAEVHGAHLETCCSPGSSLEWSAGRPGELVRGAKFMLSKSAVEALSSSFVDLYTDFLPDGTAVEKSGSKWVVADGAKAGKPVLWDKSTGELDMDRSKFTDNMSGLKLSYKAKDGTFTGSFKVYGFESGRIKSYTAKVTGVVIEKKGYGTATIKKPYCLIPIEIE